MKAIVVLMLMLSSGVCYASGQWVPVNQPTVIVQEQIVPDTVIVQPMVPQPTIVYQLTPHVVLEPVVVTRRRIFVKEETVQMVPVTRWVYQPVVVYK
jgi:hypothetical protein